MCPYVKFVNHEKRRAKQKKAERETKSQSKIHCKSIPVYIETAREQTSGRLECPVEDVENHLRKTHSDPRRAEHLRECEKLDQPDPPKFQFQEGELMLREVNDVIRRQELHQHQDPMVYYYVSDTTPLV